MSTFGALRMIFTSYDKGLLDDYVKKIISKSKESGIEYSGPIPLPTKKKIITVQKSPHIYKESCEQFAICSHIRLINILKINAEQFASISNIHIPSAVSVTFKQI